MVQIGTMRILFVTRKFAPSVGGMETYAEELFLALERTGSDVRLVKPNPPIIGRPGILRLLRFFMRASLAIMRDARHVDVILLGDAVLTPLAWIAKLCSGGRTPTAVAVHGNDVYFARRHGTRQILYRSFLRRSARVATLAIANSRDTESEANALGFRNTSRIPLATRLRPEPETSPPRENIILFAGRLIHYKGLAWFITTVLPKTSPHIQLLVAGPTWDADEMLAVEGCPRAKYLGSLSRDALDDLRARVIACVMPNLPAQLTSQNEGFGLSALESAAVGTPVVAARVGGLAEAVVDGVTGFLVDSMDATGFAARINEIAAWEPARREQFSRTARQTIAECFTWDRVAGDYLREFERLVGAQPAAPKAAR